MHTRFHFTTVITGAISMTMVSQETGDHPSTQSPAWAVLMEICCAANSDKCEEM